MMPKRTLRQITIGKRAIHAKAIGYMKSDIDPNTRLYIPFNEGVGALAKDYSQYGNHAVLTDVEWGIGYNGNAGKFNGVSSYGNCGNHAGLDITDAITIVTGVKVPTAGLSGFRVIVGRDSVDNRMILVDLNDGKMDVVIGGTALNNAPTQLIANTWNHLTYVLNPSDNTFKYYLNSNVDLNITTAATLGTTTRDLWIGAREQPSSELYFNGTIAHVIIKALAESAAQIAANCYEVCS